MNFWYKGKAMYENITIKPQFAHFFLSYLRGDYNFLHMLPDLSTMDRTLYNNLMFLKTYDGDAMDLCLTFAVSKDDFGSNEEISLIPGGENMDVTNSNKHRYIEMVAKYYVCDRIKDQCEAFRRGLWDVIDKKWLQIFNEPELQVVISGPNDGSIDVEDMKANTKLVGGYTVFDKNINRFWRVVKSFNAKQRAQLLRFVTSCERPPPLGFASMNPPFTIQRVPFMNNDQLPTASTCFNILKLPAYSSEKLLRDRLLYSIQSGCGFELT
jgi:Ubiquitin-protein ligase